MFHRPCKILFCFIIKEEVNVRQGERGKKQNPQTNNRSLRSAARVTNLFCAWHCVVFHRSPGQRGVKRCLDKWQTLLPWCLALFTDTWSSPWNGRKDKEGVAEGRNKRRVSYLDKRGRERDREMSNGGDGSYCDSRKMERDRELAWEVAGLCFCSLTAWQSSPD